MGDIINLKEVLVFIDDLIIFSDTLEEHENRLLRVLQRLQEYGLKLSPEKVLPTLGELPWPCRVRPWCRDKYQENQGFKNLAKSSKP